MHDTQRKNIKKKTKSTANNIVKRRSLTIDEVEGLEMDPNLEEPLKAKLRRESRQGFYNQIKKETNCLNYNIPPKRFLFYLC